MNFMTGFISGLIVATVGFTNLAAWADKSIESFKHDVVVKGANK
jgi:hypothetical protein